jgi:hypothetical protein
MKLVSMIVGTAWLLVMAVPVLAHDPCYGQYPCFGGAGLKGGVGMGTMSGQFVDYSNQYYGLTNSSRSAFTGGFFMSQRMAPAYAFQQEILVTQKGTQWEESEASLAFNLTYVEVTTLGKIIIPTQSAVEPSFFFGPHVGFLTSAEVAFNSPDESTSDDMKDLFSEIEVGLDVGASMEFLLGPSSRLVFEGRYSFGLTNAFKSLAGTEAPNDKLQTVSFMAGFAFR